MHWQSPETVRRILAWRAQGRTYEQIAVNLGIAPNTARNIVRRAAEDSGAQPHRSRAALALEGRPRDNR